jgi:hypothetical protein
VKKSSIGAPAGERSEIITTNAEAGVAAKARREKAIVCLGIIAVLSLCLSILEKLDKVRQANSPFSPVLYAISTRAGFRYLPPKTQAFCGEYPWKSRSNPSRLGHSGENLFPFRVQAPDSRKTDTRGDLQDLLMSDLKLPPGPQASTGHLF